MIRIKPRSYSAGEFAVCGDKSITHRAVMLNASAMGEAVVTNALIGEDCLATIRCMRALGAEIEVDGTALRVRGAENFHDGRRLDCGNSGTTMRLLAGLLAGKGVHATLFGDESISKRPMLRVAEPLSVLGAKVTTTDGYAPVGVAPSVLYGAKIALQIPSAQVKSALLLAGLSADGETMVVEKTRSRDHTERMLRRMGAHIQMDENTVTLSKSHLHATDIRVPSDISSASYFMALGALQGETLCKNVGVNPTRTGIFRAFDKLGVRYELQNHYDVDGEERADVLVQKSPLRAIALTAEELPSMIDELPLIALLCAFAEGESVITGARELRVKESDRIVATTELINRLGGDCEALEDGFIIRGKNSLVGGDIDSYLDHRIAMTATVGLLASQKGGCLHRPECCSVSFPDFFEKLEIAYK